MQIKVNDFINLIPKELVNYATVNSTNKTLTIGTDLNNLRDLLFFLKNSSFIKASILTDIVCVDNLKTSIRFELTYCLTTLLNNNRIFVRVNLKDGTPVTSVSDLYPSANWLEREIWDMFGVFFANHPDLRRILTDYGFDGHPMRKDFPLSGFVELRYDDEIKKILIEPVSLTQEFRYFDFVSPWDNQRD